MPGEKRRKRYIENREAIIEKQKEYHEQKKSDPEYMEKRKAQSRKNYLKNKEKLLEYQKIRNCEEAEKVKAIQAESFQRHKHKRYAKNAIHRKNNKHITALRNALNNAFARIKENKEYNTEAILGCDWQAARAHFESLFLEGMTWDNHGEWHIDHIKPVALYKNASAEEVKALNHISNLQPLWANENFTKGAIYKGINYRQPKKRGQHTLPSSKVNC